MCYLNNRDSVQNRYAYMKGNYSGMRARLVSRDLSAKLKDLNIQEAWDLFSEEIELAKQEFIPKSNGRSLHKKKKPLWLDERALGKVKKKRAAYQKYMQTREGKDYLEYTRARNQAKGACRKAIKKFEKQIAKNAKANPKVFYAYAKSKLCTREGIADLVDSDGQKIADDIRKAELLNKFFCSVFTKENMESIPECEKKVSGAVFDSIIVTTEIVKKLLDNLDVSKSVGPDDMHPKVLRELADILAEPLKCIFQKSLSEGVLPSQWKTANVTPLFKKGDKSKANNYRPVSLTSIPCKLLERIIRDQLFRYLDEKDVLSSCQHGFVEGRSCVTNLLGILDDWTSSIDKGMPIDAIYLDFAKAFDSVPHARLLTKLESYGVEGSVKNWIREFLVGRKQRVKVNGSYSGWADVISGVPQGSVLGPVLFVLFINDLPDAVRNLCSMYADDTKVYGSVNSTEKCESLQRDLDGLVDWADRWQMKFNADKCRVLQIGQNNRRHKYQMRLHGSDDRVQLDSVESEKDLGVTIDRDLRFSRHVELQVNRANRILGLIRRSYEYLDGDSMRLLFSALVRPHLEFANSAWSPRLEKDKKLVEGVLRRATRCVPGLSQLDYEERLKVLKIPSMAYRRVRGDLIEVYKFSHGRYKCKSPFEYNVHGATRGHSLKLKKQFCRTSVRQHFFSNRITDTWNLLDNATVNASSINSFKNRVDKVISDYMHSSSIDLPLKPKPMPQKP